MSEVADDGARRWKLYGVWDEAAGEWRFGDTPGHPRARIAIIEPALAERLDRLVAEADGIVPVSFGSLVNTAPIVRVGTLADDERCNRCGGENVIWSAPSPLWNKVMRGNDINADTIYSDLVCIQCFIVLAEEAGVNPKHWRVYADPEPEGLLYTTPSGRVWDAERWLWVDPAAHRHQFRRVSFWRLPLTPWTCSCGLETNSQTARLLEGRATA